MSLHFPAAMLPLPDGGLYISETYAGRVLRVSFEQQPQRSAVATRRAKSRRRLQIESSRFGWRLARRLSKEHRPADPIRGNGASKSPDS